MPVRAVADTDRAEILVETIFLWQYSPLRIHSAHKIGYQGGGGGGGFALVNNIAPQKGGGSKKKI